MHLAVKPKHVDEILIRLTKTYPNAKIALTYHSPWELLVATILSAQGTDKLVNTVTPMLFAAYPTVEKLADADIRDIERLIHKTGFFRAKAKNILAAAQMIRDVHHGQVPKTMEELIALPGVARKTANVVLGNAFGVVEGIAVDTHVHRISQRLRLVDLSTIGGKNERTFEKAGRTIVDFKKDADPNKIEQQLMGMIPKLQWFRLTYLVIEHGRAVCKAPTPDCAHCPLADICPASRV